MAHSGKFHYNSLHTEFGSPKIPIHPNFPNLEVRIVKGITAPLCRQIPRVPGDVSAQACHAAPVVIFRVKENEAMEYAIEDCDPNIPHCVFCPIARIV